MNEDNVSYGVQNGLVRPSSDVDHCDDSGGGECVVNGVNDEDPGSVSPYPELSINTKEFSDKLILDKIEKLNIENHELKMENVQYNNKVSDLEKSCNLFKSKMEKSLAQVESSRKELQSMVIKYATSEKEVLNLKKHFSDTDRKCKELVKERDSLQVKIKELNHERKQLLTNVERHVLESATLRNENELFKTKIAQAEVRIEQSQLQLAEANLRLKTAQERLAKIESGLTKLQNQDSALQTDGVDGNVDGSDTNTNQDVNWTDQYLSYVERSNSLTKEIVELKNERDILNEKINDLNHKLNESNVRMQDYLFKVDLIESLKEELINKQNAIDDLKGKFDKINSINRELVSDVDSSKHKEGELLEYTERLTAKLVSLQSENNVLSEKLKVSEEQCERFKLEFNSISSMNDQLKSEMNSFKENSRSQIDLLKKEIETKTAECLVFCNKVDELQNDIKIIKRKHISGLKELNKEIQTLKRQQRLPTQSQLDCKPNQQLNETNSSTFSSRTNSCNSLSEIGESSSVEKRSIDCTTNESVNHTTSSSDASNSSSDQIMSLNDIDKNVLIERILRLQRTLIKRNEKIDFLEEHNGQLTEEVRKKSKLLQMYILKEETGALATESMDKNKVIYFNF